jgi:ATP/ADP translocase
MYKISEKTYMKLIILRWLILPMIMFPLIIIIALNRPNSNNVFDNPINFYLVFLYYLLLLLFFILEPWYHKKKEIKKKIEQREMEEKVLKNLRKK